VVVATTGAGAGHADGAFVDQVSGLGIGFTSSQSVIDAADDVCGLFAGLRRSRSTKTLSTTPT
jgi:hypothetical protein